MIGGHVLVLGVKLTDCPSFANEIERELASSKEWQVEQIWWQLGQPRVPKFTIINRMLVTVDLNAFAYVIVTDDDIRLSPRFLDRYLGIVEACRFALAQPARTHGSEIHHPIVEQVDGLIARETRFVEIGPLFSMRQDALPLLTPFDETSPMGWGFDYTWPLQLGNLKMGIVDATPVDHTMRSAVSGYTGAGDQMREYLLAHPHLTQEEAYRTLMEYRP